MIYLIDHEDSFTYNLAHLLDNIEPTFVSNYYEIDQTKLEKSSTIVEKNIRYMFRFPTNSFL